MTNVVDLRSAQRLIWVCGCGCSTFFLYDDDTAECANCENISGGSEWVTPIKDAPQNPEKDDSGSSVCVAIFGPPELAKRRTLKKINDRQGELALLVSYFEDGSGSHWTAAETIEQRDWTVRKLRELADSIEKDPMNG